ncbi:SRPBCC family protein [Pedobacter yulinensis]|nr:SRPBCC family protein [Pedobacter yulinensis]
MTPSKLALSLQMPVAADPARLWTVLTTAAYIKQWLGVTIASTWQPGAPMSFNFHFNGKDFEDKGVLLTLQTEKLFSYTYWSSFSGLEDAPENYSFVSFSLKPAGRATMLSLEHSNIATEQMYQHSLANWKETLEEIKRLAENA